MQHRMTNRDPIKPFRRASDQERDLAHNDDFVFISAATVQNKSSWHARNLTISPCVCESTRKSNRLSAYFTQNPRWDTLVFF